MQLSQAVVQGGSTSETLNRMPLVWLLLSVPYMPRALVPKVADMWAHVSRVAQVSVRVGVLHSQGQSGSTQSSIVPLVALLLCFQRRCLQRALAPYAALLDADRV